NIFPAYSNECDHLGAFDQNSCTQVWNQWSHCGDHVWIYAEAMPQKKIYTRWNENCEISLSEFESRFVSCRIDLLRRCHAVFQDGGEEGAGEWTSAGTSSYSQNSHITWNNIEEPLTYGFLTLETVLYDFQNSPTAPHRVQAYQTSVARWRFDQGIQQIEKQILELNQQNEAFEIKFNEVQHKYRELINEIETEIQKHQEKQLESLREHFQEQRASLNKWVDRLNSERNETNNATENSITSEIKDFRSKLTHLHENEKFEELYNLLYKTQVEVSHLKGLRLPERVTQYASLREELLSFYFNEDGIITFLSDTPSFFPSGTLQSDKNSLEGLEIRHQINRGIIAYHNAHDVHGQLAEEDLEKKSLLAAAFGFLRGADSAVYEGNTQSARELLHIAGSIIDTVLGFIPVAST
ncbi:MAG: hypothetical protein Q7K45_04355, partial [Nanoarchaeota archaeon]|nr:hypothetical protein [Nanoarchaeota archaeon]